MSRPISDAWFHRIKAATRDLVNACGGIVRAGEIAHASKSEVSRWQSARDPDIITLPALLALEADCGIPHITAVQADLNGARLATEEVGAPQIASQHAEAVQRAATMMAEGARVLADGKITPAEAASLDRAVAELGRALPELRLALSSISAAPLRAVPGGRA